MKNYSTDITVNETRILIKGITWLVTEMRGNRVLLERFDKKFTKSESREYVEDRLAKGFNIINFPQIHKKYVK